MQDDINFFDYEVWRKLEMVKDISKKEKLLEKINNVSKNKEDYKQKLKGIMNKFKLENEYISFNNINKTLSDINDLPNELTEINKTLFTLEMIKTSQMEIISKKFEPTILKDIVIMKASQSSIDNLIRNTEGMQMSILLNGKM